MHVEHQTGPDGHDDRSALQDRTDGVRAGSPTTSAPQDRPSDDPLLVVRGRLDAVDDLPLQELADVFERTHAVVTDELKKLEIS